MTTFDLLMIPVWLFLSGCFGLWIGVMTHCICFQIQDRRDRQDSELISTQIIRFARPLPGLDTQIRKLRGIHNYRDYRALQDLIETKAYTPKGEQEQSE